MSQLSQDDLRAAVGAGHLSEAQAASVMALAARRADGRAGLTADDEPFELFRGFAEVFITCGLAILMSGISALSMVTQNGLAIGLIGALTCFVLARYFTLRRRMVLPSILLVAGFAASLAGMAGWLVASQASLVTAAQHGLLIVALVTGLGLAVWYAIFRLPFTMALIAICGFAAVMSLTTTPTQSGSWGDYLVLTGTSNSGIGILILGLATMALGIWFDMRDPLRLGRSSASGFWLHLVAAPAIVNTLALTAMRAPSDPSLPGLALTLLVVTVIALVLDRRSFLTAGLGYLIWLIWAVTGQDGEGLPWPFILILIGAIVTALGSWWVPLRARLMRALPDFPGKDRLPPYEKGTK